MSYAIQNSVPDTDTIAILQGVDTRARIFIYYGSGQVDSLCIDALESYTHNGKNMKFTTKEVIYFVDSLDHLGR